MTGVKSTFLFTIKEMFVPFIITLLILLFHYWSTDK